MLELKYKHSMITTMKQTLSHSVDTIEYRSQEKD
jgi:hypothetical protein